MKKLMSILLLTALMLFIIGCKSTGTTAPTTTTPSEPTVTTQPEPTSAAKSPESTAAGPAENSITIDVEAFQFGFSPDPIRVKQGQTVTLRLTSRDVTHGFLLPDFNVNEQIEPGKTTTVTFTADKKGEFEFRCSVFCGSGHSRMKGKLIVE